MIRITVSPGQEVIESASRQLADHGVTDGAVVSLIGGVDACTISNMPADDATNDVVTEYEQPFELSGTGEITGGNLHLHAVLGTADGNRALAGHLHRAEVHTWFVHLYVLPLPNPRAQGDV